MRGSALPTSDSCSGLPYRRQNLFAFRRSMYLEILRTTAVNTQNSLSTSGNFEWVLNLKVSCSTFGTNIGTYKSGVTYFQWRKSVLRSGGDYRNLALRFFARACMDTHTETHYTTHARTRARTHAHTHAHTHTHTHTHTHILF